MFDLPEQIVALADKPGPVVVVNVEGVVVLANEAAGQLWGMEVEDMVGEFQEMLLPKDRRWGHQAYRRGYFADASPREMDPGLEPHLLRADGSQVPVHIWLEPHRHGHEMFVEARISRLDDDVSDR
jgi:PAS domain S-box-containing protein